MFIHVKTGELNADVLIADEKLICYISLLCTVTDIQILHEVLHHKNLVLYKKQKNSITPKFFFQENSILEV